MGVVPGTLLGIGQDLVGCLYFGKLFRGVGRVIDVAVRVQLERLAPVCFFDPADTSWSAPARRIAQTSPRLQNTPKHRAPHSLVVCRRPLYAEQLVVARLLRHRGRRRCSAPAGRRLLRSHRSVAVCVELLFLCRRMCCVSFQQGFNFAGRVTLTDRAKIVESRAIKAYGTFLRSTFFSVFHSLTGYTCILMYVHNPPTVKPA